MTLRLDNYFLCPPKADLRHFVAKKLWSCFSIPNDLTDDDVHDLIQKGRKIEAIKAYRAVHGVGLKEARDAVEQMTQNP